MRLKYNFSKIYANRERGRESGQESRRRRERRKIQEWLDMKEVGFVFSGMAWNRRSRVWTDWNGLEWTKLVLA
jgi:hypothetical protein